MILADRRQAASRRRPMARRLAAPPATVTAPTRRARDAGGVTRLVAGAVERAVMSGLLSGRRLVFAGALAGLAIVAFVGISNPATAGGASWSGAQPVATVAPAAAAASNAGPLNGVTGGLDLMDLATKGILVLVLLFITLRILGRVQGGGPRRSGLLTVIESRTLASKASLHLVAVGERRLVVGLTPSGMVALAELGADELAVPDEEPAEAGLAALAGLDGADGAGGTSARWAGRSQPSIVPPSLATLARPFLAPVDGFATRLGSLLAGGRAR